jgi:hypothetical protein
MGGFGKVIDCALWNCIDHDRWAAAACMMASLEQGNAWR